MYFVLFTLFNFSLLNFNRLLIHFSDAVQQVFPSSVSSSNRLIYNTNKNGPRTEPWGTPSSTFLIADKTPFFEIVDPSSF
jgi:hypothetical protein